MAEKRKELWEFKHHRNREIVQVGNDNTFCSLTPCSSYLKTSWQIDLNRKEWQGKTLK
jgi:hypothetical protein